MASVLIVDDDFLQALNLESFLQLQGHMVCGIAKSGEDAVTFAEDRMPDVVIMDVRLFGQLDGVEAAKRIVSRRRCGLIFVTGFPDARLDALAPDAIIVKPARAHAIHAAVELVISQKRKAPAVVH